jgi:hypothetical protein
MNITFEAVLRDIHIVDDASDRLDNHVFLCQAFNPETNSLTQFTRLFHPNGEKPWVGSAIIMDDVHDIGSGEDPRPFFWRGSPCISSVIYSDLHGFINRIYVKNLNRWFMLVAPKGLNPGKNWAPFVQDDELYFVHEYAPFRVLKASFLSEDDDFLALEIVAEHGITTAVSGDRYSQFRGGANALQFGNKIVGFGHTNQQPGTTKETIVHRPFLFIYEPGVRLDYYACNYDFPSQFRIVDPTSLYFRDGKLCLVTCETEQVWSTFPQTGRSCLYTIDIKGLLDEDSSGSRGRRLHRWSYGDPPQKRRFLGAWRRSKST